MKPFRSARLIVLCLFLAGNASAADSPAPQPVAGGARPAAFLGAMTGPVPASVSETLGLPEGLGLTVFAVQPGSPAAALLKANDVLLRLDDQKLVSSEQLAVLLRTYKEGDQVALTFWRDGKEANGKVRLASQEPRQALPVGAQINSVVVQSRVGGARAGATTGLVDRVSTVSMSGNATSTNIRFRDETGSIDISVTDGHKVVTARSPEGAELFSGPFNTETERTAAPAAVRARVEEIEKRVRVGPTGGGYSSRP